MTKSRMREVVLSVLLAVLIVFGGLGMPSMASAQGPYVPPPGNPFPMPAPIVPPQIEYSSLYLPGGDMEHPTLLRALEKGWTVVSAYPWARGVLVQLQRMPVLLMVPTFLWNAQQQYIQDSWYVRG